MNLATFIIAAIVFIPMVLIIYNQVKKLETARQVVVAAVADVLIPASAIRLRKRK